MVKRKTVARQRAGSERTRPGYDIQSDRLRAGDVGQTAGLLASAQEGVAGRARNRLLLIFSARILDSSVERGMPRRAAAPDGPKTRPPVARKASSTTAFSCVATLLDNFSRLSIAGFVDSQLSSTVNSSVSHTITDRSITFCSSRMFPGHGYDCRWPSARLFTRRIDLPAFRAYRSMQYLTSRGISSLRSRKGGIIIGNTFSR